MNVIEVQGLRKVFPPHVVAVDGIDFSVRQGEIFGLLGPNGAGKTTTIRMLITLVKPTAGRARVCGVDIARDPTAVRANIGYVSQYIAVDEDLSGRDNLILQGHFYHLPGQVLEERIHEVLAMVDLADRAGDKVETYSGGMRKRLDIAAGLLHRPRVLFLDEPTLGLDIQTRRRIWDYIRMLRDTHGLTVVLTTHYMEEADTLCDRIAIIDHGKIVALDTPQNLKQAIGDDLITIEVDDQVPTADQVSAALRAMPGVERVEQVTATRFQLAVKDGAQAVPRVVSGLAALRMPVSRLTLKSPTLDDVFLYYTGHELRSDEGAQDSFQARVLMRRVRGD